MYDNSLALVAGSRGGGPLFVVRQSQLNSEANTL